MAEGLDTELPDTAYVSVKMGDLYFAWRTIFPVPEIGMPAKTATWTEKREDISIALIRRLRDELVSQDRFHDPSTGIFDYDLQPCLQMLSAWLHGKDVCPRCHGEGIRGEASFSKCPHPRDDGRGPAHEAVNCTDPEVEWEQFDCPTTVELEVTQ